MKRPTPVELPTKLSTGDEEAEWQPAVIVSFEKLREMHPNGDEDIQRRSAGRIVRVRPDSGFMSNDGRCIDQKAYQLHPDDYEALTGLSAEENYPALICEHQFMTD
jgi:hypothetical protein